MINKQTLFWIDLSPGSTKGVELELENLAYQCWHNNWQKTFEQLDGTASLYSDDFSRQSKVLCLFQGLNPIGIVFLKQMNPRQASSFSDSYFKPWPHQLLQHVRTQVESDFLVCSYLTVEEAYRGHRDPFAIKDILSSMAIEVFRWSGLSTMIATTRNGKGMNELVYKLGAEPLMRNLVHHGVSVDMVKFNARKVRLTPVMGMPEFIAETYFHTKRSNNTSIAA